MQRGLPNSDDIEKLERLLDATKRIEIAPTRKYTVVEYFNVYRKSVEEILVELNVNIHIDTQVLKLNNTKNIIGAIVNQAVKKITSSPVSEYQKVQRQALSTNPLMIDLLCGTKVTADNIEYKPVFHVLSDQYRDVLLTAIQVHFWVSYIDVLTKAGHLKNENYLVTIHAKNTITFGESYVKDSKVHMTAELFEKHFKQFKFLALQREDVIKMNEVYVLFNQDNMMIAFTDEVENRIKAIRNFEMVLVDILNILEFNIHYVFDAGFALIQKNDHYVSMNDEYTIRINLHKDFYQISIRYIRGNDYVDFMQGEEVLDKRLLKDIQTITDFEKVVSNVYDENELKIILEGRNYSPVFSDVIKHDSPLYAPMMLGTLDYYVDMMIDQLVYYYKVDEDEFCRELLYKRSLISTKAGRIRVSNEKDPVHFSYYKMYLFDKYVHLYVVKSGSKFHIYALEKETTLNDLASRFINEHRELGSTSKHSV